MHLVPQDVYPDSLSIIVCYSFYCQYFVLIFLVIIFIIYQCSLNLLEEAA